MANPKLTNIFVFLVFFGSALIEAFQKGNWLLAGVFLFLAVISLWADFR